MNSSSALLDVQNLRVSFSTEEGTVQVLKGLSYSLPKGKVLAVVGESGSGKTVHALSLLRLLPPTADIEEGHVLFEGKDLVSLPERQLRKLRGARISMIFQDPMSSLNPVLTVGEQLKETILAHRKISKLRAKAAAKPRPYACLKKWEFRTPPGVMTNILFNFPAGCASV